MIGTDREDAGACARQLGGIVSRHERALLLWLAARVPYKIAPDHFTLLGVSGAFVTALGLTASHVSPAFLWLALFGLLLNWVGDSLDGTIARLRRIERYRYGFFVDHISDVASQVLIVLGLGLSPYLRFDIVCLALVAYLVLSIYTLVKLHVSHSMQLTYFGIGPTEIRVLIGAGIVLAATTEFSALATPIGVLSMFDGMALIVVAFAVGSAAVMFVHDASQLAVSDPPRTGIKVKAGAMERPIPGGMIEIPVLRSADT